MKTLTEIVQRLLDEGHISAEEAVIILQTEVNKSYPVYIPAPMPSLPYSPPFKPGDIWYTSSTNFPIAGSKDNTNE
jgi:hypothetical protein